MNDVDTIDGVIGRSARRRHSVELKAQVLDACEQPGASVAAIARLHGLNANVVHRWRSQQRGYARTAEEAALAAPAAQSFVSVHVKGDVAAATMPPPPSDIRIELRRGACTATVLWPVASAPSCAAWLSEWLR